MALARKKSINQMFSVVGASSGEDEDVESQSKIRQPSGGAGA
jgi:hypothetical protein